MFPYPIERHSTDPCPLPKAMWKDFGLTPEQALRLGPLLDVRAVSERTSPLQALRRVVGAGLVRVGRLVQGPPTGPARAARDPFGGAA